MSATLPQPLSGIFTVTKSGCTRVHPPHYTHPFNTCKEMSVRRCTSISPMAHVHAAAHHSHHRCEVGVLCSRAHLSFPSYAVIASVRISYLFSRNNTLLPPVCQPLSFILLQDTLTYPATGWRQNVHGRGLARPRYLRASCASLVPLGPRTEPRGVPDQDISARTRR